MQRSTVLLAQLTAVLLAAANAASPQSSSAPPHSATPQRPTFTADTSVTAPGTAEIEFGATGTSSAGGLFALPSTLKFTPDVSGFLRLTEISVSFDAVRSIATPAGRHTAFSDTVSLVARKRVYENGGFSFAVAPRAIFLTRNAGGARLGARALAAYSAGAHNFVGNFTWTSATSPSATNPAQQYDVAFDYSRALGADGWRSHTGIFAGVLTEKPKHSAASVTLGQGITYRVRPNWVVDFAVRQRGLAAGPRGYELLTGLTYNIGRLR